MKILLIHNSYQQRGGEDAVVEAESQLLAANGHSVLRYTRHNDELRDVGPVGAIRNGIATVWASKTYQQLRALLAREKPDLAHFHNTFPLISPSAYYACAKTAVPTIQTLHNYRLLCPAATFVRADKLCESCLGRIIPLPAVTHRCYRGSCSQTAVLAAMLTAHKIIRTWWSRINMYIALSEFARQKFIQGGFPSDRIVVKPNFIDPDPGPKAEIGRYALFVGRLSPEKGIRVLLEGWTRLEHRIPLYVAGDGPLRNEVLRQSAQLGHNVHVLGHLPFNEVREWMRGARFLILPSICFENFPVTVAEAFACGLPVIASRLGSLAEIIVDGQTGLHFTPGNAEDLARTVEWAWVNDEHLERIGRLSRRKFEQTYTAEQNYRTLMQIYSHVLESTGKRNHAAHANNKLNRAAITSFEYERANPKLVQRRPDGSNHRGVTN